MAGVPESLPQPSFLGAADDAAIMADAVDNAPPRIEPLQRPALPQEWIAVALLVVLTDVTVYRGAGYAGVAALLLLAPPLLWLGTGRWQASRTSFIIAGMLGALAARSAWLGSPLGTFCGIALLVAFAMTLNGWRPYLPELFLYYIQAPFAGIAGAFGYYAAGRRTAPCISPVAMLSVGLPLAAVCLFGTFFILANPDLATSFADTWRRLAAWLQRQWETWTLSLDELAFCVGVVLLSIGLLRPLMKSPHSAGDAEAEPVKSVPQAREVLYYGAIRNTLVAVNVLFAVYLTFEFATLWFRAFPPGFYYAGHAHEGAAWLTAALALATLVLSLIFRGEVLHDARIGALRRWAWIWSALNLLLALSVYNRMYIYIDFNGMTRMRTIGLFGISAVVVGFCLVLWKILHNRGFLWLVRQQLATVAVAAFLFVLTPVDWLVHSYNVRQITHGDLAPSVQISVHPINAEGILAIQPLVDCPDEIIRDGVRAMLAERWLAAQKTVQERATLGWTSHQLADQRLLTQLEATRPKWSEFLDDSKRAAAKQRFDNYAYQWY